MDMALLVSAIITGLISLIIGLVATEETDTRFFINPLLQPLKNIRQHLKTVPDEECPNCPDEFVEPYAKITLRRYQLGVGLGSIAIGLIAQVIILLTYGNYSAAVSYFVWAMLPTYLVLRYILELRDVFYYWAKSYFRPALSLAIITIGVMGSVNPYAFDFVGWVFSPMVFLKIGDFQINSWLLFSICAVLFLVFLAVRYYLNLTTPSTRNRILRTLKTSPQGYTINEWRNVLDPSNTNQNFSEEHIKSSLTELVYQGKIIVRLDSRRAEPRYASP